MLEGKGRNEEGGREVSVVTLLSDLLPVPLMGLHSTESQREREPPLGESIKISLLEHRAW